MDRIDNVDLREALQRIAENNTFFHLHNDIGISFDQMERAAKLDDPTEKSLIWVSNPGGIDCYTERETFVKDSRGNNGVHYHGFDMQSDRKLAYTVEVTAIKDGKIYGNLYETDIRKYADNTRQNALASNTVRLYLADPRDNGQQITMPKDEFNRRYPLDLPKMTSYRYEPDNPAALYALLDGAYKDREANSTPSDLWQHTSRLYDERYAFYANQTMRDIAKLGEPNSPDKKTFSVTLNPYVAIAFGPEELGKLLDALPYKDAAFTIQKGQRDMRVVVPRDEVLKERKAQAAHEKPSIIGQLQEAKKTAAQGKEHQKSAPKRNNDMEV